ncbi:hypothetical protein HMPREF9944_00458 [Segatella maculosa OT 289]|uniref:Uncharacterized protein n=1 Tax=Segatella maculosa OT 289 TaxID=999422 RepID=H1HJW4_9BACT|nr:hypothetical protein HMPREF9944_00458 [Segatella maculosa OT 289]
MKYPSPTGEDIFFNNQLLSPPGDDNRKEKKCDAHGRKQKNGKTKYCALRQKHHIISK